MLEKTELGAFMFGKPGCDLLSVLLKSTSCFCFDPLSSCFSKEFIHSPFFSLIILLFYLSYLKRKRKKSSSRSKPSPPPPPRVRIFLGAGCPAGWTPPGLQLSALRTASTDNTGLTSRDLLLCGCLPASKSIWSCPREP